MVWKRRPPPTEVVVDPSAGCASVTLDERRRSSAVLSAALADGRLTAVQYVEAMEDVGRATSRAELESVTRDVEPAAPERAGRSRQSWPAVVALVVVGIVGVVLATRGSRSEPTADGVAGARSTTTAPVVRRSVPPPPTASIGPSTPAGHTELAASLPNRFGVDDPTVYDLAFSPDGRFLATTGGASARVFDVQSMALVCEIHEGDGWAPIYNDLRWSPDSTRLALASFAEFADVWDIRTCTESARIPLPSEWGLAIDFSADGTQVVTASSPNFNDSGETRLRWWSSVDGTPIGEPLVLYGPPVWRLAQSPTDVFAADDTGTIYRISPTPHKLLETVTSSVTNLRALEYDPVHNEVVTGGAGGLWLWHPGDPGVPVIGPTVEELTLDGDAILTVDGQTDTVWFATTSGFTRLATVTGTLHTLELAPRSTTIATAGAAGVITTIELG